MAIIKGTSSKPPKKDKPPKPVTYKPPPPTNVAPKPKPTQLEVNKDPKTLGNAVTGTSAYKAGSAKKGGTIDREAERANKPKAGGWATGEREGPWESGKEGPWESGDRVGRWEKNVSDPKLVGSGGMVKSFDGQTTPVGSRNTVTPPGAGGGGGGAFPSGGSAEGGGGGAVTGPAAPGLAQAVESLGLKGTNFAGRSVEEVVGRGARRTRKTGQRRSQ